LSAKFVSPKGDRPYLRVKIFGVSLLGLLDSGAAVTVIGDPGWLKLRSLGLTLHPHQPVCVADGSVLAVSGSIDLPIEVSGRVRVSGSATWLSAARRKKKPEQAAFFAVSFAVLHIFFGRRLSSCFRSAKSFSSPGLLEDSAHWTIAELCRISSIPCKVRPCRKG
jgi:hypothetical protein